MELGGGWIGDGWMGGRGKWEIRMEGGREKVVRGRGLEVLDGEFAR